MLEEWNDAVEVVKAVKVVQIARATRCRSHELPPSSSIGGLWRDTRLCRRLRRGKRCRAKQDRRKKGMMEEWKEEILEYWNYGIME